MKKPTKEEYINAIRKFFFEDHDFPSSFQVWPIGSTNDPRFFIEAHIRTIEARWGNPIFRPYLRRIEEVKSQMIAKSG